VAEEENITVEQPAAIEQILARHFTAGGMVLLIPVNDEDHFVHSNMMGLNPARRTFVVSLPNQAMLARLQRAPRIRVQALMDHLLSWFYVDEFSVRKRGSTRVLELSFPKSMTRAQRRSSLRVDLPPMLPGTIVFAIPGSREVIAARIIDLSATGCALAVELHEDPMLDMGSVVKAGRLRIGDDIDLKLRFYVRNRRQTKDGKVVYGVEFDSLSDRDDRRIFNLVYKIQRRLAML